jgi:hypothetical protein
MFDHPFPNQRRCSILVVVVESGFHFSNLKGFPHPELTATLRPLRYARNKG